MLARSDDLGGAETDRSGILRFGVAAGQAEFQGVADLRGNLQFATIARCTAEIRGELCRAYARRESHSLLHVRPIDVKGAYLYRQMAAIQPILGTDFITPERILVVGRGDVVEPNLTKQVQAGGGRWKRCVDAANTISLGGAQVQQIVVVQLKIYADLRVFGRLALLTGDVSRCAGVGSGLEHAVIVRGVRDTYAGRNAPLFRHLVSRLPVDAHLLIGRAF